MTYDEYAALPGVRASDLKLMRESPLHYRYPTEDTDTAARAMLRAIHCAVLEGPDVYTRDYAVYDGIRRSAKFQAFRDAHHGSTILNPGENGTVSAVAESILHHPDAGQFFTGPGQSELVLQWVHPGTGMECKARLDRLVRDSDGQWVLLDLKSYGTTEAHQVSVLAERQGALIQLAHYDEGLALAMGIDDARLMLVSAETKPPYDVGVFEVTRSDLYSTAAERELLMVRMAECQAKNYWPGRNVGIQRLFRPLWTD